MTKGTEMKAMLVFGARPSFVKIAPIHRAMHEHAAITPILVNTGCHYGAMMSDAFVAALGLPRPDVHLQIDAGTGARHVAGIIEKLDPILGSAQPDVCIVVGDAISTLAASLACAAVGVSVAHVEAGVRGCDSARPDARRREVTDRISELLFTPTEAADHNLLVEGIRADRIHRVGNVMVDALEWVVPRLPHREVAEKYGIPDEPHGVVTLQRPETIDEAATLREIFAALEAVARRTPLLLLADRRLEAALVAAGVDFSPARIRPLPVPVYAERLALLAGARFVITDGGELHDESIALGRPCCVLEGAAASLAVAQAGHGPFGAGDREDLGVVVDRCLADDPPLARPPLWDGATAPRIVDVLLADDWSARRSAPRINAAI